MLCCSVIGWDLKWCDLICWSKDSRLLDLLSFLLHPLTVWLSFNLASSVLPLPLPILPSLIPSHVSFSPSILLSPLSQFLCGSPPLITTLSYLPSHILLPLSPSLPYLSVFMWVPSLIKVNGTQSLPTGLVFSSFMLAMTFGGMLFGLLLPVFPGGAEGGFVLLFIQQCHLYFLVLCWVVL